MEKSLKETENVKLKLFCCKECNKTFKSEHAYLKHDQRHKKNHSNENSSGKTSAELKEDNITTKNKHGKKYECETCKKQFRFKNSLKKHETRHQYNGFACRNCGETFSSTKLREKHRENVHKTWQCFICHIRFESENKYLSHVETLHEGRNRDLAVCNVCGKQFKSKSQLTPHLESKCGTVKRFKCDICDALLMTTGALHNHRLRHAGAHAHMCRFCAKTFVSAGQLTVHERVHTQEKAFVCEICNKGFCHRQSLITHSTLHTGIKPFQCEGCSKAFSCIGNLLKHRRTHADTCGALPLTTHRVKNPETRAKVQANTPNGIKLRQNKKKSILLNRTEEVSCKDEICIENNAETMKEKATSETVQKKTCEFVKVADLKLDEDKETNSIPPDSDINPIDDICLTKRETNENINGLNLAERHEMVLNEIKDPEKENILESESSSKLVCKQDATKHSNSIKCEKSDDDMEKENRMGSENNLALTCQEENIIKGTERCSENPVKLESVTEIKNEISDDYEMDRISNFDDNHHDDNFSEDETFKLVESKPKSKKTKRKTTKPRTKRKSKENISKLIDEESFRNERKTGKGDDMACKICGLVFNRVAWLVRHEATHEKRPLESNESTCFKCNCCNESFQTRDECVTHQEKFHRNELGCEICNKMFANRDSRRTHINYYHKGIPRRAYVYVCDKCGKTFKQKNALSAHEISNCGVSGKVFKCEVCEKQFSNIYSRRAHMKIHEGDKGQICKFCGKSFVWKGQLKVHERSHTGEKPYKCQFCPKAFAHRESLITHNSIHTGFKPHVCEGCGSRFSCIGNLFKHRRTHSSVCSMSVSKEEAISKKKHKVQVNMQGVKLKNSSQQKSIKGEENKNDVSVS